MAGDILTTSRQSEVDTMKWTNPFKVSKKVTLADGTEVKRVATVTLDSVGTDVDEAIEKCGSIENVLAWADYGRRIKSRSDVNIELGATDAVSKGVEMAKKAFHLAMPNLTDEQINAMISGNSALQEQIEASKNIPLEIEIDKNDVLLPGEKGEADEDDDDE